MKPQFIYMRAEAGDHVTFHAYCGSPPEAREVVADIQTLCGSRLERDEDFVYVAVDTDRLEEAILELEKDGYTTVDGDAES